MRPRINEENAFASRQFALALGQARTHLSLGEVAEIIQEILAPEEIEALNRELKDKTH